MTKTNIWYMLWRSDALTYVGWLMVIVYGSSYAQRTILSVWHINKLLKVQDNFVLIHGDKYRCAYNVIRNVWVYSGPHEALAEPALQMSTVPQLGAKLSNVPRSKMNY